MSAVDRYPIETLGSDEDNVTMPQFDAYDSVMYT